MDTPSATLTPLPVGPVTSLAVPSSLGMGAGQGGLDGELKKEEDALKALLGVVEGVVGVGGRERV